ncbi:hypothetical protein H4Q26_011628 [Puccinia striiformis f. sp. tritici PST-130]|nr:hypothetical protein H4Q26_011628 [Puccinia striiformis f. sp. tritici PST-130]
MVRRSFVQTANSPEIWLLLASSTFMTSVHAALDPALSQVAHHSDLTRRSLFQPSANSQPAPATVQPQATVLLPPTQHAPSRRFLTAHGSNWALITIWPTCPGGTSLKPPASVGAPDFICGIGDKCQAGQLCSPVQAPGWEVLVAAQEWNNYQNKFYEAVGTAVQMVTFFRLCFYLSEWQKHAQKSISNSTRSVIAAGVTEIVSSLKNTTTVRILTDILRSQEPSTNALTRARWRLERQQQAILLLPNGTMFNIIHSSKKKAHNTWWNAELISKKYGISVEI